MVYLSGAKLFVCCFDQTLPFRFHSPVRMARGDESVATVLGVSNDLYFEVSRVSEF